MASNTKNKYPADKTGTKYSEFKNTKRTAPGKTKAATDAKHSGSATSQAASKTANAGQ